MAGTTKARREMNAFVVHLQPHHRALGNVQHHPSIANGLPGDAHAGHGGINQNVRSHVVVGNPFIQRP